MMNWLDECQNVEAIVLNVVRTLTRLSLSPDFVDLLRVDGEESKRQIETLLHLLFHYQQETPILVRICYILGNLTMVLPRKQAEYFEKNVPDLVSLLESIALDQLNKEESDEDDTTEEKSSREQRHQNQQALIKIMRLVANLAVDSVIGRKMVGMIELECLVDLLEGIHGKSDHDDYEELELNILAALANFSFYGEEHCNYIYGRRLEIGKRKEVEVRGREKSGKKVNLSI